MGFGIGLCCKASELAGDELFIRCLFGDDPPPPPQPEPFARINPEPKQPKCLAPPSPCNAQRGAATQRGLRAALQHAAGPGIDTRQGARWFVALRGGLRVGRCRGRCTAHTHTWQKGFAGLRVQMNKGLGDVQGLATLSFQGSWCGESTELSRGEDVVLRGPGYVYQTRGVWTSLPN